MLLVSYGMATDQPPFPDPFNEVTDLVVIINETSVFFDPPNTTVNQTISFNAIVKNRFGKDANATLEFRLDNVSVGNKTINAPGNSTQILPFNFTRTKENHTITVIIDPEDVVNESYFEDNNEDEIIIYNQSICGNGACENNENSNLCPEDCYKFYCDTTDDCIFQGGCCCGYYVNYKFYNSTTGCNGFLCTQMCENRIVSCTNNICITGVVGESNGSLKINKTISKKNVKPGDKVIFSLVVRNTKNTTAYNVAVRDNLEYNLNYINGSESAFYCNETDNITQQCINYKEYDNYTFNTTGSELLWELDYLYATYPGNWIVIQFNVSIGENITFGEHTNTANVTFFGENKTSSVIFNVIEDRDLIIGKLHNVTTFSDNTPEKIIDFILYENQTTYLSIPEHATIINASFNVSGFVSEWNKSDQNPVLNVGETETWDSIWVWLPYVIKDNEVYNMWYTGVYEHDRIGFANSSDGINWARYGGNPVLTVGVTGMWDARYAYYPSVIKDNGTYKMWYSGLEDTGEHDRIGYAISDNGTSWYKYGDNLCTGNVTENGVGCVFGLGEDGSWDDYYVFGPKVIYDENEKIYKMWYSGGNAPKIHITNSPFKLQIGYATSTDGIHWTRYSGNPVLTPGEPGSWDEEWIYDPVVISNNGLYEMWYSGMSGLSDDYTIRIGYAVSTDGVNWTKYPGYVLGTGASGEWDDMGAVSPAVIKDNGTYKMWYTGMKSIGSYYIYEIGYAENKIGYNIPNYPDSIFLDAGNDNIIDWSYNDTFNVTKTTSNVTGVLNEYLKNCTFDNGNCSIPLKFNSNNGGVKVSNILIEHVLPDVWFNESNLGIGNNLTITTGIYNAGSTLNNITIEFLVFNRTCGVSSKIFSENKTINAPENYMAEVSFNWTVKSGIYNFTIFIDPNNKVIETDENNNRIDFSLKIGNIIGDANEDCVVDLVDLMIVAQAFHTKPGDEDYNPKADLKKDNFINIFDLAIVGKNFGGKC